MASNGSQTVNLLSDFRCRVVLSEVLFVQKLEDAEINLEKIKRQLTSGSGRNILQGPLYKRSETVKWIPRILSLELPLSRFEIDES